MFGLDDLNADALNLGKRLRIYSAVSNERIYLPESRIVYDRCLTELRAVDEQDALVRARNDELIDTRGIKIRRGKPVFDGISVSADEALCEVDTLDDLLGQIPAEVLSVRTIFASDKVNVDVILEKIKICKRICKDGPVLKKEEIIW